MNVAGVSSCTKRTQRKPCDWSRAGAAGDGMRLRGGPGAGSLGPCRQRPQKGVKQVRHDLAAS